MQEKILNFLRDAGTWKGKSAQTFLISDLLHICLELLDREFPFATIKSILELKLLSGVISTYLNQITWIA